MINSDYLKSENDFWDCLKNIYGSNIEFELETNQKLQSEISKNIINFLIRLLYKLTKNLPINDKVLVSIRSLNLDTFNLNEFTFLCKPFSSIIPPNEYHKLYSQCKKWKVILKN